ncbi:MAG TPA: aspartate dehydrogenase [Hyphomicrobiaceae bacterium]|nr:aspartate dehydrogenase [Hyphomicrobiaceae bacterium]
MRPLRLAIAGLGAIGLEVARRVDGGSIPGMALVAVAALDQAKARARLKPMRAKPKLLPLGALAEEAEVVVECVPAAQFAAVAEPAVNHGRLLMPLSVGALLGRMDLVDRARETGARIVVPSGAILGLDALRAASEGSISSVRLITRKPPEGLAGAPFLAERGLSVDGLTAPVKLFAGSAREAVRGFPANLNVSIAVALAGIGPDRTEVEVWADPQVTRNTHTIEVHSDSSDFTMTIENIPCADNPRTGRITALSVIASLRRLAAPLVIGT